VNEIDCKELVETITAYLDGTLPDSDRRRFDNHLVNCPYCADWRGARSEWPDYDLRD
jgi:anti-sigma factor RsiW